MKYLKKFNENLEFESIEDLKYILIDLIDNDYEVYIYIANRKYRVHPFKAYHDDQGWKKELNLSKQQSIYITIEKTLDIKYSTYDLAMFSKGYSKELYHKKYLGEYEESLKLDKDFKPVKKQGSGVRRFSMKESEEEIYNSVISNLVRLSIFLDDQSFYKDSISRGFSFNIDTKFSKSEEKDIDNDFKTKLHIEYSALVKNYPHR